MRRGMMIPAACLALALGGCSLFHDSYPDKSCESNADCFTGTEVCNTITHECQAVGQPDAAVPQPDASEAADAAVPDASVTDVGVPDAL